MNDLTIRNFEEIKDSLINIKKPIQNRGNYYFDIFYKNELLLFQTNITKLISKGYYNEFIMYDTAFKEKLQQLLGYIYKTIIIQNKQAKFFLFCSQ